METTPKVARLHTLVGFFFGFLLLYDAHPRFAFTSAADMNTVIYCGHQSSVRNIHEHIALMSVVCLFAFLMVSFDEQVFDFDKVQLVNGFYDYCFLCPVKQPLPATSGRNSCTCVCVCVCACVCLSWEKSQIS